MTIKSLTKANAEKYGFVVREDLNFEDDGNHFRGFSYKGLPLTQCTSRQYGTFLSIRVDYIYSQCEFTSDEWRKTEEYKLEDEFNGCSEINVEKLIENCERIIAKIDELNAKYKNEEVDTTDAHCKAIEEVIYAQSVVDKFKAEFKWYEVNEYKVQTLSRYLKSTISSIESAKKKINEMETLSRKEKKQFVERLENYGYVIIKKDDFYLKEMMEALN